jgi:3-oxoadipate enol-lactonase / 4-carboxymuconolactone decarboxylase
MPHVTANGVNQYYEFTGPENADTVVFAHSLGCTHEMWDAQIAALSGRYRCLRYDIRGHGHSSVIDSPATIDDLAADLIGLLDALKIANAHIVGLSLGGMVAQALACEHPQRVRGLILMATAPYLPPADFWHERAALVRAEGLAELVNIVVERWFTPSFLQSATGEIARIRERFLEIDRRGYARCCEVIADMDLRERIKKIAAPTLLIFGADDPVTPPAIAEEMSEAIPGAEAIVLPKTRHLLNIERAHVVCAHLHTFLALGQERHIAPTRGGDAFERGLTIRKSVLGADHVDTALDKAGDFGMPWQDFITRNVWGDIWGDPTLSRKTRSMLTLTTMIALHREEEFKLHVRPALSNGVTTEELRALVMQAAVYAGVPAANAAFRWVRDVLGEELS